MATKEKKTINSLYHTLKQTLSSECSKKNNNKKQLNLWITSFTSTECHPPLQQPKCGAMTGAENCPTNELLVSVALLIRGRTELYYLIILRG